MIRNAFYLLLAAASAAALIAQVDDATRTQRDSNQAAHAARLLLEVLPAGEFDQPPGLESVTGADDTVTVFPVRLNGNLAAAALQIEAPEGYVGPITLLIGVEPDGRIVAVRAARHRETPGLGDKIDISQSDWILQFGGRQLQPAGQWALQTDGGDIDQISGATITSRAVTDAVHAALEQFALFQTEPTSAQGN